MRLLRRSLLWKLLVATSLAVTLLFGLTGVMVQRHAVNVTSTMLEAEVQASFRAYESLWRARAERLASVSSVLSSMSDVRAAFSTRDSATIRDTAGELWSRISDQNAIFLVSDPEGRLIASLGGAGNESSWTDVPMVRAAAAHFPRQVSGFLLQKGSLYQVAVTPVYVESTGGASLLNVLVAGFQVDQVVARDLKEASGGSDFVFAANGQVLTSTLPHDSAAALAKSMRAANQGRVTDGAVEYAPLARPLLDVRGNVVADLWIFRSFKAASAGIESLRRDILLIFVLALLIALLLTYLMGRQILGPIQRLDRAAAEVAGGNYEHRIEIDRQDELGRLAGTFNAMCESIRSARRELVHQERISTIGRLATSIVHDLRNPLAAIYGGAEMLVDSDLPMPQVRRLAANIYRASQTIQTLLQDLLNISRRKAGSSEKCQLKDVIAAAYEPLRSSAEAQSVSFSMEVPEDIELMIERGRMERVFLNLLDNAIEAMPEGGSLQVSARTEGNRIVIDVKDSGPGLPDRVRTHLFEPFVSHGKKNGLGLGLALARQTIIEHGGDISAEPMTSNGTHFRIRLLAAQ